MSNAGRACVVLPTYDERENVGAIVPAILAASPRVDVLVVDDNSPDGTGAIADELAAHDSRVHVLHRPHKDGLGPAYLAGFEIALREGYGRVLEMDADFSHDPAALPALLAVSQDADVVLGSRYVRGGGTVHWGWGRRLLSRGGNLTQRLFFQKELPSGIFKKESIQNDAMRRQLGNPPENFLHAEPAQVLDLNILAIG